MYLLLDAALLSEWVPQELTRETRRRYFELGKQLREYQLATYTVENADMEVLRNVFGRVNTSGKPMTRDEVFDAIVGSRVVEGDDVEGEFLAMADELGLGVMPWSPLKNGILTGKYARRDKGNHAPDRGAFALPALSDDRTFDVIEWAARVASRRRP